MTTATTVFGRPQKSFGDSSERSKRRKTQGLRETVDTEELTFATQMKLRACGKPDASKVLKEITKSPKRATKYRKAYSSSLQEKRGQLSPLQALSMFVEAGLSRRQYEIVRASDKTLYPCYSVLQKAKKDCYPVPESYQVTATCAEINLQDLLNHTVARLLLYLQEVVQTLSEDECNTLELITKWGCDGSQQTQFKQKFETDIDSDANIFQSSLVPLQLVCGTDIKKVIWKNPTPSSPRYCRPIKIRFVKESADLTREEIGYLESKIVTLNETKIEINGRNLVIKHTLILTMIDAKICNAATNTTSTMKCYICGATSKEFNSLSNRREADQSTFKFGLSTLHARIRLFESLLHLSYKLPLKKWQLSTKNDKEIYKQRKTDIQNQFKNRMGIIVDVPKPGSGNSNDGNTSRRFFMDPALSAEITGMNVELIYRFRVILEVISSGHKVDTLKFAAYTMDTAKLYVQLYSWHPMTPTMHKILIHGPTVIENALLPIGQLSEEAAEARNKHFRSYRQNYARKFSRESCNLDIINRLLLSSDPLLTSMRPTPRKRTKPFLKETTEMLLPSLFTISADRNEDDESASEAEESSDEESWE
ncbi:uncharacterized protein [Periplaneta americana]|uniref:uncharacterized protein n=1 Tax=Periplaneta americana TaxID=6978 RepID=UPI0037E87079